MNVTNKTLLNLPFEGKWYVFWGGDSKKLNIHHGALNQKFAYDFCIIDSKGKTYSGKGDKNEDYCAFGKNILSPANGIVTDVIEGVKDNIPGSLNPYSLMGNCVFIKHSNKEVSIFAHLKYGGVKVSVGDSIKRGQIVGLCGNSGNSSEPHLHYHLQNSVVIQNGRGIKCYFQNVTLYKDGEKIIRKTFSPVKGDIITPSLG